jgi:hypothetical protein
MLCCVALSESLEFSIQNLHQKEYQEIWAADLYQLFYQISGETGAVGGGGHRRPLFLSRWLTHSSFIEEISLQAQSCDRIGTSWLLPLVQVHYRVWERLAVLIGIYEAQCIDRQNFRFGLKIKYRESTSLAGRASKNKPEAKFMTVKLR